MAPFADYLTINISSPNTPGLRNLQAGGELVELLAAVREARPPGGPPVFLKVAPDLDRGDHERIVAAAIDSQVDALIVANTTVSRPPLKSRHAGEAGGLSGAPLKPLALDALRAFRAASGGEIALIAAGGIASADDAWQRIAAGASLVQIYSALVYQGPGPRAAHRRRPCRAAQRTRHVEHCRGSGKRLARSHARPSLDPSCSTGAWRLHLDHRASPASAPGVVSAADPRAADAGAAMLRQGGSATDAALATLLALTVVEPQSSGIGGGGFLVTSDARGTVATYRRARGSADGGGRRLVLQGRPAARRPPRRSPAARASAFPAISA